MNGDPHMTMDLDFILHEIVQCDNEYCPDLQSMYLDAAILVIRQYFPEKEAIFLQCEKENRLEHECGQIFTSSMFLLIDTIIC